MTSIFMNFLNWIYSWVGNYGWSVVVFTLLVRLVLLPLDIRSKKGMRAMSKIQPKVQALQKKYANDKDKLNQKTMELYKKEHVSPTAGCLPMLISLPILWIMFTAMRVVANEQIVQMILNMKETNTLPTLQSWLWIKNVFQPDSFGAYILPVVNDKLQTISAVSYSKILTQENIEAAREFLTTDAYAQLAKDLIPASAFISTRINLLLFQPVITIPSSFANMIHYGNGLFILPLLAGFSQFFMTKIMNGKQEQKNAETTEIAKKEEGAANDVANTMNSPFMKWFFPIFSVYICASYTAAFAIYWMAANVIQIVQQLAVNAYFDRQDAIEAAKAAEDPED